MRLSSKVLSHHEAFKPGFSSSQSLNSAPWNVVSWLYTSAGFPTYFRMCVWQYRRGKNWSDMSVKALYLFCIDIISWRIPTRTPNKVHLAANRNDDFFFLQNSVFIEERWPQPFPLALMAPCQPSLHILKSVVRSPVSHQKRKTLHCFYVHFVSRSTPSDMEGFGIQI